MLAIRDTARDAKIETTETGTVIGEIHIVVRKRPRSQFGKEQDGARPARRRRKVVDGIALDLRPLLNRLGIPLPLLGDRRKGDRFAIRRLERQGGVGQFVVRRLVEQGYANLEEHPFFADRAVRGLVSEDHVGFVVVRGRTNLPSIVMISGTPGLGNCTVGFSWAAPVV
jgi:hypothetical protein